MTQISVTIHTYLRRCKIPNYLRVPPPMFFGSAKKIFYQAFWHPGHIPYILRTQIVKILWHVPIFSTLKFRQADINHSRNTDSPKQCMKYHNVPLTDFFRDCVTDSVLKKIREPKFFQKREIFKTSRLLIRKLVELYWRRRHGSFSVCSSLYVVFLIKRFEDAFWLYCTLADKSNRQLTTSNRTEVKF